MFPGNIHYPVAVSWGVQTDLAVRYVFGRNFQTGLAVCCLQYFFWQSCWGCGWSLGWPKDFGVLQPWWSCPPKLMIGKNFCWDSTRGAICRVVGCWYKVPFVGFYYALNLRNTICYEGFPFSGHFLQPCYRYLRVGPSKDFGFRETAVVDGCKSCLQKLSSKQCCA